MTESRKHEEKSQFPVSEELFLKYVNNELSPEEKWEVEKILSESSLLSDAEEGLQLFTEKKELPGVVLTINQKMNRSLKGRRWKTRRNPPRFSLILIVTIIFLLLLTLAFWIIYRLKAG